jgi:Zn-dependent M28 family amino/carboxypeptidase
MRLKNLAVSSMLILGTQIAFAQEKVDLNLISKIRDEGLNRSQIMQTMSVLTDEIGPRLTGAPGLKTAGIWTKKQLSDWGLQNAQIEGFEPFGRGWTLERASLRMIAPNSIDVVAIPKAWTAGTDGVKRGKAVYAKLEAEEDLTKWKGKLNGTIVLRDLPNFTKPHTTPDAHRYSEAELHEMTHIEIDNGAPRAAALDPAAREKRNEFNKKLQAFLREEGIVAMLNVSRGDDGTIFVQGGGSYKKDEPMGLPTLVVSTESYNRIYRLIEKKKTVEMEVDVQVAVTPEDPEASINVFADIPGTDKKDEFVMLGGHLDSWHGGTGATDNAAGVAVAMEAVRILKAIGFKPRRTIRVALWGGEEQGLIGSRAFVNKYVASRGENKEGDRRATGPLQFKPMHAKISTYFNLDNGTGRIRGVYAEGNTAIKPIFDAWLAPFHDLGAKTTTLRKTGSTDHVSFDAVGVPGFQFIQDKVDYFARTHHSNMDVYDKIQKADMVQAATIMASFIAHAANRDELLPRKALPPETPRSN